MSKWRNLALGLAAGFTAGYAAVRATEAWREYRAPSRPLESPDAGAYADTRRALQVVDTIRSIAGVVSFVYGPLGERADRATLGAPPWLRPALLVAPLALATAAVELPISYVEDYAMERRYKLSDQTPADWFADYLKGSLLSAGISTLVASLLGIPVRHVPRWWPAIAAAGVFPFFVLGNIVVPLYVLPMFNSFEPVTGSLEKRLRRLAGRFGVGDADILRMDMSKQTRKANAFVTGIGKTHRIVLGDTLMDAFPENEIEFVVAHELGHYVNRDTWRMIGIGQLLATVLFFFSYAATPSDERERLAKNPLLILRFYSAMLLASQALRPVLFAFSRSREWASDRFALGATGDSQAGAAAFRRLRDQNLADEDPPGWYEFFFSSHPSLKRRIEALEQGASGG